MKVGILTFHKVPNPGAYLQAFAMMKTLKIPDFMSRLRVGLALSGGVARGVVHVGVLSVLEKAGIPIDYVAGTSNALCRWHEHCVTPPNVLLCAG